jgi:hypothetical protein
MILPFGKEDLMPYETETRKPARTRPLTSYEQWQDDLARGPVTRRRVSVWRYVGEFTLVVLVVGLIVRVFWHMNG